MILIVMITILISKIRMGAMPLILALAMAAGLTACGNGDDSGESKLSVVATTSIWADVASQVVGDDGIVEYVVPIGADAHDYQASPRQVAAMEEADLVIANGLGLEEGLSDVLESIFTDGANIVELAPHVDPIPFSGGAEHEGEEQDHDHESLDPHVWFDPDRVAVAARLIAAELASIDGSIDWSARADAYAEELSETDTEIARILSEVSAERRLLVTNHDALEYFAGRYDFEVIGVVIPGGSTLAEPSSAELAALVAAIEESGTRAIFAETTQPTRLAEAVAAEVGEGVSVVELYTSSLGGPDSEAVSLLDMLMTNARRIADALS